MYYISGGFLEVQPNMVKVLADTVVRAGDLDEAAAQEALKAAEKALQGKGAEFDYSAAARVWPKPQPSCAPSSNCARSSAADFQPVLLAVSGKRVACGLPFSFCIFTHRFCL